MNIYAKIIIDELEKRGIKYDFVKENIFNVFINNKIISCHESLCSLINLDTIDSVSDKYKCNQKLKRVGLNTPASKIVKDLNEGEEFLNEYSQIVVKPNHSEQGEGITIDITTNEELKNAYDKASKFSNEVILEEYIKGDEYRVLVIGDEVVAIAYKKPAFIKGDGKSTIIDLIFEKNEILKTKTGGESKIEIESETMKILKKDFLSLKSILPKGKIQPIKYIANLHKGGELIDKTNENSKLIEKLKEDGLIASKELNLAITGVDFIVKKEIPYIIELNERPGLANHEPNPTAKKFVDFLIKESSSI